MDNPEKIHRLLAARTPEPLCDDCIATESGISPRQQANVIVRSLALTRDFERTQGVCARCAGEKRVTRSLRHVP